MAAPGLSIGDLAAAVVAQDDDVRAELKGLVQDMVRHMRFTMRHGEPAQKTALAKSIVPQLLGAINKVDGAASEQEERAAYERMTAALRGETGPVSALDLSPEATVDART